MEDAAINQRRRAAGAFERQFPRVEVFLSGRWRDIQVRRHRRYARRHSPPFQPIYFTLAVFRNHAHGTRGAAVGCYFMMRQRRSMDRCLCSLQIFPRYARRQMMTRGGALELSIQRTDFRYI